MSMIYCIQKLKLNSEIKHNLSEWKYADTQTGKLYKLYTLQDLL
jgi:hypothetical protein